MNMFKLPFSVKTQIFLRSFLLQASWNFERLQNLGVLYVLAPALRFLYSGEDLKSSYQRHVQSFNTNPFLASPILGATLALEKKGKQGEDRFISVEEFKKIVMAPFAAVGDAFFWGGLRPFAAGIALFFAAKGSLWAPVVFLVLFNIPHLWFRTVGLMRGYSLGFEVVEVIQRHRLADVAVHLKEGTVVVLGGLCAYLFFLTLSAENLSPGWGLAGIPVVVLLGLLTRKGGSVLMIVLALAAVLIALPQVY